MLQITKFNHKTCHASYSRAAEVNPLATLHARAEAPVSGVRMVLLLLKNAPEGALSSLREPDIVFHHSNYYMLCIIQ